MTSPNAAPDELVERCARKLVDMRGLRFALDPMEYGQDAYDISLQAMEEARAIIRLAQAAQAKEFAEFCEVASDSHEFHETCGCSGLLAAAAHARQLMEKANG